VSAAIFPGSQLSLFQLVTAKCLSLEVVSFSTWVFFMLSLAYQ